MIKYGDTISSQTTGQPIYGAQVTVLNAQGLQATIYSDEAGTIPLSQPILTDQSGYFSFYIDDGRYNVVVMAGQAEIARTNITMVDTLGIKQRALLVPVNEDGGTIAPADARKGMVLAFDAATGAPSAVLPNAFAGPPGGSDSAFLTLADLKGSDPVKQPLPRLRTGGTVVNYAYVAGDFTGRADDVNVVKLDAVPLTTGALVRQSAQSLTFVQAGAGAVAATVDAALKLQPLSPISYGAKWDGVTDDAAAIQRCIDAADAQGRPILFPTGTAIVKTPLRTFGKMVVMSGVPGRTIIKAGAAMRCVIDDVAADDSYYNPLWISGLVLDGGGLVTEACISHRFRHHVVLDTILAQYPAPTAAGFRAQDCWLGRYYNLRTLEGGIGFAAMGANHSSTWDSCDFNAVRSCHVLIDNQAIANDGNHGLTFIGCSIEFSMPDYKAVGLRMMDGTSAKWEGGYIGENLTDYVIDNRGGLLVVDGAICFACHAKTNSLVRPFDGLTLIRNGRVADQNTSGGSGLVTLCCNVPDSERGIAKGKVRFDDVDIFTPLGGGTRMMNGDFLASGMPGMNFVKSVGRVYQDLGFGGQTYTVSGGNGEKTLTATNSTSSIMALYAPLARDDFIEGRPIYIAIVYKATQPCVLALTTGGGGAPAPTIDTLPATDGKWCTFINVLSGLEAAAAGLQLYMNSPQSGAVMGLRMVTMSDARVSQGSPNGGPVRLGHI